MHEKFAQEVEKLNQKYKQLLASEAYRWGQLPKDMPRQGVYLFSKGGRHLYVGRSNSLRKRYSGHCRPGSGHYSASFAFKMAREETGNLVASYKADEKSRKALAEDPEFKTAFDKAKERVRAMEYRFVEVKGQREQTLLELYVAMVLDCPYNDFDTH